MVDGLGEERPSSAPNFQLKGPFAGLFHVSTCPKPMMASTSFGQCTTKSHPGGEASFGLRVVPAQGGPPLWQVTSSQGRACHRLYSMARFAVMLPFAPHPTASARPDNWEVTQHTPYRGFWRPATRTWFDAPKLEGVQRLRRPMCRRHSLLLPLFTPAPFRPSTNFISPIIPSPVRDLQP